LAIDREIDIPHDRTVFDLGVCPTVRAEHHRIGLLDHQLDLRPMTSVMKNTDVFEADQGPKDLARIVVNEGVPGFFLHTSKTGAPSFTTQTTPR